jgi:hypothetical protein
VEQFPASVKAALGTFESDMQALWWYDTGNDRLYAYSAANPANSMTTAQSLVRNTDTCAAYALCFIVAAHSNFRIIDPILQGGNVYALLIRGSSNIAVIGTSLADQTCRIGEYATAGVLVQDLDATGSSA